MNIAEKPNKHVIILGAGASASSRFPLANDLRLLMSSKAQFIRAIDSELEVERVVNKEKRIISISPELQERLNVYLESFSAEVRLFRRGAFGTVDEFCRLANPRYQIQRLKELMKLCLLVSSPELKFEESDYYLFAQRLFHRDTAQLNPDVAVLSFNYDPHLDTILTSAYLTRCEASDTPIDSRILNSLNGGLLSGTDHWWQEDAFCLLKLHGTVLQPVLDADGLESEKLFKVRCLERIAEVIHFGSPSKVIPVVFPWEVFDTKNQLLPENVCQWNRPLKDPQGAEFDLHKTFGAIWHRARKLLQQATKISFVGLSLHPYLVPGLKYLFGGREGRADGKPAEAVVVIADTANKDFEYRNGEPVPEGSPCRRYSDFLESMPGFRPVKSRPAPMRGDQVCIPRYSFRDFIEREFPL